MNDYEIKARQLRDNMKANMFSDGLYDAKQCALLAVDEILKNIDATILYHKDSKALPINKDYWLQVRTALSAL